MPSDLNSRTAAHWHQLRGRTLDLLALLDPAQLDLKLNFPASQSIFYQYWCMLGAQQSWQALFETGEWAGFACTLTGSAEHKQPAVVAEMMREADEALLPILESADLTASFGNGSTRIDHYLSLVEHEAHHQGQLINFIYAQAIEIPESWFDKWHLTRD
jgi:hypothetical protein